ncbi:SDR family oxidoreductase [Streptomyces malaysiensis]|uniref:SDR family oxidoreductase n=1 Tax=Streptomyces malaysiensis subsp. samsunensis TaxID=459658 RepID=A0A9X2RVI5_STRMQ|nr:SDR family oxidoreductase [Streptomyces samsunensis]MCQ8832063.1 SDR family oxidoreductase [Streptomyces samsunensis]
MNQSHGTRDPGVRRLAGKTALVTGAPRSIGRAIAEALAEEGANIVLHYRSRETEAHEAAEAIRKRGVDVLSLSADLTRSSSVRELFDLAIAHFGGLDIVVANAGVTSRLQPVAEVSDAEFDRVLAVNTRAVFYVLREAARRVSDGGRIINISSSSTRSAGAGFGAYATSKNGANATIRTLAKELSSRGITANSIHSGAVGDGFLAADSGVLSPEMTQYVAASAPAGRLGEPSDIAPVARFLALPEAEWINGQALVVNGGSWI